MSNRPSRSVKISRVFQFLIIHFSRCVPPAHDFDGKLLNKLGFNVGTSRDNPVIVPEADLKHAGVMSVKMPNPRGMPRRLRLVLLVLCAFMLAVAVAEFVIFPVHLRSAGLPSRTINLMGFHAEPKRYIHDTWVNAMGFTGAVPEKSKVAGTVRVLTLGGSVFFNRRFTERLTQALAGVSDVKVEVVGAALQTHTTRSSLLKYRKVFRDLDFDVVLIYHGVNDLWMHHVADSDFRADYSHYDPWYRRNILLDNSILCRLLYNAVLWRPPAKHVNGATAAGFRMFEHYMGDLVRECKDAGAEPVLISFAWYIPETYTLEAFKRGELDYSHPGAYMTSPVELWGGVDYVEAGIHRHNAITASIAESEHVPHLDQAKAMPRSGRYFDDPVHLSDEGVQVFVAAIAEFCRARKLLTTEAQYVK